MIERPAYRPDHPRAADRARLRADRGPVTWRTACRELRKWLKSSPEGRAVETAVAKLLA